MKTKTEPAIPTGEKGRYHPTLKVYGPTGYFCGYLTYFDAFADNGAGYAYQQAEAAAGAIYGIVGLEDLATLIRQANEAVTKGLL